MNNVLLAILCFNDKRELMCPNMYDIMANTKTPSVRITTPTATTLPIV